MPKETPQAGRSGMDRLKDLPVNRYVCGRLRALRQAKGLRVEDVARKSGIPLGS